MKVRWFVTYTMREIKKQFELTLVATRCGDDASRREFFSAGSGRFQAMYTALCDIDPHIAELVSRWYMKELDNLHRAELQAYAERQERLGY